MVDFSLETRTHAQLPPKVTIEGDDLILIGAEHGPLSTTSAAAMSAVFADQLDLALVKFQQTGTGAVERNAKARFEDTIHDLDYTTLAQAVAAAAGKTLLIVSNRTIAAEIVVPDNTIIRGAGGKVTVSASQANGFVLGNDCAIYDVEIIGPSNSTAVTDFAQGNGIYASGKRNIRAEGNSVHGWNGCGIQIRDCINVGVRRNLLYNNYYGNGSTSDICFFSGTAGYRIDISFNFCLSNNSQGVYFNALGVDADCTIVGNLTDTLNADFSPKVIPTTAGLYRRHGIIASYNGGANGGRLIISCNLARNTAWTGIYCQNGSTFATPVVVTGNLCVANGFELGNSLSGGIYVNSKGGELVTGNMVLGYRGSFGSITLDRAGALTGRITVVQANYLAGSAAAGVSVGTAVSDARIIGNTIIDPTGRGIDINLSTGDTSFGGFEIDDNYIRRSTGYALGINYNPGSGQRRSSCRRNTIIGTSRDTNNAQNRGVGFGVPYLDVTHNRIVNVFYAIDYTEYLTLATRYFNEFLVDYNVIEDCKQGICLPATASSVTIPVEGNIFRNVETKLGGGTISGSPAARIGARLGDRIVAAGYTAAPANGTWAIGDRAQNEAPAAGGAPGWYCTATGSPGTWKAEASIAA